MKSDRMTTMVDCLLHEGKKTAWELAERFEVSVRTIYRDIDTLCLAGVPIIAAAGIGGGYEIDESYRIDRSFLSNEELQDLVALLSGYSAAMEDRNLNQSLQKIRSLGKRGTANGDKDILPPQLITSLTPWGGKLADPRLLADLRRAVFEHRPVNFQYVDSKEQSTQRCIEPYSVILGGAAWYLYGWCRLRGAFRLFKILRITKHQLLNEHFDPLRHGPVPEPFSGDWEETLVHIRLSVDERVRLLANEHFNWVHPEGSPDGSWVYDFYHALGPHLERMILSLGAGVEVLSPKELRASIREQALGMAERNKY